MEGHRRRDENIIIIIIIIIPGSTYIHRAINMEVRTSGGISTKEYIQRDTLGGILPEGQ